jgi:fucose permease
MSVIILQLSQNQEQSYVGLGVLEFFKDIPNAIISIFLVDYIKRYSYTKALSYALITSAVCSFSLPFLNEFWFLKVWFFLIGISFSIGKICVFSIMKHVAKDHREFSSLMNKTEASFVFGIFLVNIEFAMILKSEYKDFWKLGFWLVGIIALWGYLTLMKSDAIKENNAAQNEVSFQWKSLFQPYFLIFYGIVFMVIFTEQIFNSWLPTFYSKTLKTNAFFALLASAFLALFSFFGRLMAIKVVQKIDPFRYFYFCGLASVFLLLSSYFWTEYSQDKTTVLLLLFPLVGVFISPLYPLINSKFLSHYPEDTVGKIVSIIILFTSLGGSIGSISTSIIFHKNLGEYYLLFATIPLILILVFSLLLSFKEKQHN